MSDDEHRRLYERLDEVMAMATEARDEARGAHDQARTTNGRVDRVETHVATVRKTLWGRQDDGIQTDGGLVGWARQTRRDIRILGGLVIVVVPVVVEVIDRIGG